MGRKIATLLAALSLLAVVPATAQAQDDIKLVVSPTVVKAGSGIQLTLDGCKTPTEATSPGFRSPAKLDLHGGSTYGFTNVGDQPGRYTATATCEGQTYTAPFEVVPIPRPDWSLGPLELEPGGTISSSASKMSCGVSGPVTSPGFTEPLYLDFTPPSSFHGSTTVIMTPGTYTATFTCFNYPKPLTEQFTIKAPAPTPPAATPTTTSPAGKPKAPVVKPKGAPQTGGGGTA